MSENQERCQTVLSDNSYLEIRINLAHILTEFAEIRFAVAVTPLLGVSDFTTIESKCTMRLLAFLKDSDILCVTHIHAPATDVACYLFINVLNAV